MTLTCFHVGFILLLGVRVVEDLSDQNKNIVPRFLCVFRTHRVYARDRHILLTNMNLKHLISTIAILSAALTLSSCGASKKTLKRSNQALMQAMQAAALREAAEAAKLYSDTSIPKGEARKHVSRDTPGQTALEKTIIRWAIDSDPQGARVFYRVLSSIPAVVKNTNETYLMTTPYEETRSFNILGLTYENSRDVQIEIKVVKSGYEPQVKRFNVRQALDQQEISSFFMLVPKEE